MNKKILDFPLSEQNNTFSFSMDEYRIITTCNRNYSKEGILHPDRIMNEYDLLYLLQGEWNIWEEDTCYSLKENQVLLLEPGKRHYSLEKCTPEMKNLYIHFSVLKGDNSPTNNLSIQKQTDCSNNLNVLRYFEEIIESYWANYSHKMNEQCSDFSFNKNLKLASLLNLLLIELSDIRANEFHSSDVLIASIIHRFNCSTDRFFSPKELADDYHVSLRTISTRFKEATGQSIHQYQLNMKLNMAYELLPMNPGRGLRDIALSLGFYDEFQFSKLFKRQFGISPSTRRSFSK